MGNMDYSFVNSILYPHVRDILIYFVYFLTNRDPRNVSPTSQLYWIILLLVH